MATVEVNQKAPGVAGPFADPTSLGQVSAAALRTRHLQLFLFTTRSLQVALCMASCIVSAAALAQLSSSIRSYHDFRSITNTPAVLSSFLALYVVILVMSVTSAGMSLLWLAYVVSPARRADAMCCGKQISCSNCNKDRVYDSIAATAWLALFIAAAALSASVSAIGLSAIGIPAAVNAAILALLFIGSAALSSKMHRQIQQHDEESVCQMRQTAAGPVLT